MTRRLWAIIGLAVIGLSMAGVAAKRYLYPRLPFKANLIEGVRRELATRPPGHEGAYCLSLPMSQPTPDARSKLRQFGWHADFVKDTVGRPDRLKQFERLDALAAVGLLEREETTVPGTVSQPAFRYRLTAKGWAQQVDRRDCLVFGSPSYQGFVGSSKRPLNGESVQVVTALVGISGPDALAAWARDARVQQAFPQIVDSMKAREEAFFLQSRGGRWQRYVEPDQREMIEAEIAAGEKHKGQGPGDRPDPTRAELEAAVAQFPHQSCLVMPGDSALPVDKQFYGGPFRFGIYVDKARASYDLVANRTMPVVERLVAAGSLVRLPNEPVQGEGVDKGKIFDTAVYVLAPQLQALMMSNCISLGPLTQEFVEIQYGRVDRNGVPKSSYTYKKIVRLKSPPAALTDALLLSTWPDLRGALEHGHACSGEFLFDKESRKSGGGMGSCWYAFDSFAENR